jgi:hypothetical protein
MLLSEKISSVCLDIQFFESMLLDLNTRSMKKYYDSQVKLLKEQLRLLENQQKELCEFEKKIMRMYEYKNRGDCEYRMDIESFLIEKIYDDKNMKYHILTEYEELLKRHSLLKYYA